MEIIKKILAYMGSGLVMLISSIIGIAITIAIILFFLKECGLIS